MLYSRPFRLRFWPYAPRCLFCLASTKILDPKPICWQRLVSNLEVVWDRKFWREHIINFRSRIVHRYKTIIDTVYCDYLTLSEMLYICSFLSNNLKRYRRLQSERPKRQSCVQSHIQWHKSYALEDDVAFSTSC